VPFLPFVVLLAWQAVSRSASFALGWATSLYFGQVPGRQGRMLSVVSLVSAGWVILVIGFAIPIFGGAALEAAEIIDENFDATWVWWRPSWPCRRSSRRSRCGASSTRIAP
jgi:hypothetical protein